MTIDGSARGRSERPGPALAAMLAAMILLAGGCAGSRRVTVPAAGRPLRSATPPAETRPPPAVIHVVEAGQTLWRIARVYGVTLDELTQANGIDDPTGLRIGQRLVVPGATAVLHVPPYPAPLPLGDERVVTETAVAPTTFEWPIRGGRILSGYGAPRRTHRHTGIDIGGSYGQPVRAAEAGRVVYSGSTLRGYGKTIIIDHGGDLQSLYAHNSELLVDEGTRVERGQVIARVGRTGNATADHCHFEVRRNDVAIDPFPYLGPMTEGNE